jgi:hypothetical protein
MVRVRLPLVDRVSRDFALSRRKAGLFRPLCRAEQEREPARDRSSVRGPTPGGPPDTGALADLTTKALPNELSQGCQSAA